MNFSTIIKWVLLTTIMLSPFKSYSQLTPDSIYYNQLFHLCKVWGHVKYYHTEVASGSINWDDELLIAIDSIKNAGSNEAYNDAIITMLINAGPMGTSTATLPEVPDTLNNNTDLSWIYDPIFSDSVSALLDTISQLFRPQSNVYLGPGVTGLVSFLNDTLYYSGPEYPDEGKRMLALFRHWNIIHYFSPYKNIMDQLWDTTLVEFIPKIAEANNALTYHLAFKEYTTRLNDSHTSFSSNTFSNWDGIYHAPFLLRFIENETVITKVIDGLTSIHVGDIIKAIDGQDIYEWRDSLRKFAEGSNEVIVERSLNRFIQWGNEGDFELTVENGSGQFTNTYQRNELNFDLLNSNNNLIWTMNTTASGCRMGIVDMGLLEGFHVSQMFNNLWDADAIVFDVRNYPNNTLTTIVDYLFPSFIHHVKWTVPYKTYPGRLHWVSQWIGNGTTTPYEGKVIILFDERTQSHAEWTCMGLEQFPEAIKIGSTTSGADGNVAYMKLPGGIDTRATFLGTYYPDYSQTQRVGIIPDIEVHPTILGIRNEVDEVMDFALNLMDCGFTSVEEMADEQGIVLYPNPVSHFLQYELSENYLGSDVLFEIVDIQGRKLKTINISTLSGEIDFSDLNNGLYFVKIITNTNILIKAIIRN